MRNSLAFASVLVVIAFPFVALAEESDEEEKEVLVTALASEKSDFETPYITDSVDRDALLTKEMPRSVPDALTETPGVLRQKTAQGQSSPFIRGFTSFRTVMLIDGVRLNNSMFREGPNQYWSTVDPFMVERIEVVKGPSSVLYGSDAIGGTVQAFSVSPECWEEEGYGWQVHEYFQYRSAEDAFLNRLEFSGSLNKDIGVIVGGSWRDFGDVTGGPDVGRMENTDYFERNGDIKLVWNADKNTRVIFAHQLVNQDDVWRTHKTTSGFSWHGTTVGSEYSRILDQDRQLTYLQIHREYDDGRLKALRGGISWQVQEEDQFRTRPDGVNPTRWDLQGAKCATAGLWAQSEWETDYGDIIVGGEWYRDNVHSFKHNWRNGVYSTSIQGPVSDNATYDLAGLYIQDTVPLADKWEAIAGLRFTYAAADADKYEDPTTGLESSLDEDWSTVTGSLRMRHDYTDEVVFFGGVSQGFRAPNLSDLTRLDTARSNEIETPAPGLDPENFVTFEAGTKVEFETFQGEAAIWYTWIDDMIIRRPTGNVIGGDDEVTRENAGDGYAVGIELAGRVPLSNEVSAFGSVAWMDGEAEQYPDSTPNSEDEPLTRMLPTTFLGGLRWDPEEHPFWLEGLITIVDGQDDLNTRDERDAQRIPPDGTPGYTIYGFRGGYRVSDHVTLGMSVENLTNKDYRIHGSGVNEPGTNAIVSVDIVY